MKSAMTLTVPYATFRKCRAWIKQAMPAFLVTPGTCRGARRAARRRPKPGTVEPWRMAHLSNREARLAKIKRLAEGRRR